MRSPPSPICSTVLADAGQFGGAIVTIGAMCCQVAVAHRLTNQGADYVLSLKANQPTLEADVLDYFRSAPAGGIVFATTLEKYHGRIETRKYRASADVGWIAAAIRVHWGVETMHWLPDVQFKGPLPPLTGLPRQKHGCRRCFALDLVRARKTKESVKARRMIATRNPDFLL